MLGGAGGGCFVLRSLRNDMHGGVVEGRSWPSDHFLCPEFHVLGPFMALLPWPPSFVQDLSGFEFRV